MDPLILILTIVSCILATLLAILAIQAFLVLREAQKTLHRVNAIVDVLEHTAVRTIIPLSNLGGFVGGVRSGLKMFESFMQFLHKNADNE